MLRRMAIAAALSLAACGSYRRVAPLDDAERAELTTLRASLAGRRVVVPDEYGRSSTSQALELLGVTPVAPRDDVRDVAEVHGGGAMGVCMNPMLATGMTLGLLPYTTPHGTTWECRFVAADGRERAATLRLDDTSTTGWLGLPLALLPGRSAFFFSGVDEAQKSASRERVALFLARNLAGRVE